MVSGTKTTKTSVKLLVFSAVLVSCATLAPLSASALPDSCNDFQKLVNPRMALISQINGFKKKKPTAGQACTILTRLTVADKKILDWMNTNKDWCQIPDDQIAGLKQASGQSASFKNQACNAASQQAKQLSQMRRQQQQQQGGGRQTTPGAGVRLPQGAL